MTTPHGLQQFQIIDNRLCFQDRVLSEYATDLDDRACYLYFLQLIHHKIAQVRQQLPTGVNLLYAIKANPYAPLVADIAKYVDGFDVSSMAELQLALSVKQPESIISFAGPAKSNRELQLAIEQGVTISVESANELQRIIALGTEQCWPQIVLRLNPPWQIKASGMHMTGEASAFGIDMETLIPMLQSIRTQSIDLVGLHIYSFSQCLQGDVIAQFYRYLQTLVTELSDHISTPLRHINVGGGWGIPYFEQDRPLKLVDSMQQLTSLQQAMLAIWPDIRLSVELGRYLVGEAGVYLCQVRDIKHSYGKEFAVVNGGMHHHQAAAGLLGQVIKKNYPIVHVGCVAADSWYNYELVGQLCTPLDHLGRNYSLPRLQIGDVVAILQSGAYGYTSSPLQFLSHTPPEQILV